MKHIRKTTNRDNQKSRKPKTIQKSAAAGSLARQYLLLLQLRKRLSEMEAWPRHLR
jgi:hypothetical protein